MLAAAVEAAQIINDQKQSLNVSTDKNNRSISRASSNNKKKRLSLLKKNKRINDKNQTTANSNAQTSIKSLTRGLAPRDAMMIEAEYLDDDLVPHTIKSLSKQYHRKN